MRARSCGLSWARAIIGFRSSAPTHCLTARADCSTAVAQVGIPRTDHRVVEANALLPQLESSARTDEARQQALSRQALQSAMDACEATALQDAIAQRRSGTQLADGDEVLLSAAETSLKKLQSDAALQLLPLALQQGDYGKIHALMGVAWRV